MVIFGLVARVVTSIAKDSQGRIGRDAQHQLWAGSAQGIDLLPNLELSNSEFMVANPTKNQFVANVSHETRTQLSGIVGMTERVLSEDITPHLREHLGLVNDILDISGCNRGDYRCNCVPCRFGACSMTCIETTRRLLRPRA